MAAANDPDQPVTNVVSGPVTGIVIQAREIHGDIHMHRLARAGSPGDDRHSLRDAVHAITVPVSTGSDAMTGFFVTPRLILTVGGDQRDRLSLRSSDRENGIHAFLAGPPEPNDPLWVWGYVQGVPRWSTLYLDGSSAETPVRLRGNGLGPGLDGAPVINWRTGAVCGVLGATDPSSGRAVLLPISLALSTFPELARVHDGATRNRVWLDHLDDSQLHAGGWRYPGRRLRMYLDAAMRADREHPYVFRLPTAPPLSKVYLRQQASPTRNEDDEATLDRIDVDSLLDRCRDACLVGDPGAGKSSLVRHLTAASAARWLAEGRGEFVPLPIAAEALARNRSLPNALAEAVVSQLNLKLSHEQLVEMFGRAPMDGIPWLVLVDGLDEIMNQQRRRNALWKVIDLQGSPEYRFLVTSRPVADLAVAWRNNRPTFVIEPFDRGRLRDFALRWFTELGHDDPAASARAFLARVDRTKLRDIAGLPLISTMLCVLYDTSPSAELPNNQAELYDQFVSWLMGKLSTSDTRARLRARVAPYGPVAESAVDELLDGLENLIQDLAHDRQGLGETRWPENASVAAWLATRPEGRPPAAMPAGEWIEIIGEALRASGLLVQRGADLTFLHQTVEEYFAAGRLARDCPDPRTRAGRQLVKPQHAWPWPDLEVKTFLAARWLQRGADLHRPLKKLLSRRHRSNNVGFLVELTRQGLALDPKSRARAIATLSELLADPTTLNQDWQVHAQRLGELDPATAARTLDELARSGTKPENIRFEAANQLALLDRDRGLGTMEDLTVEPSLNTTTRMAIARLVVRLDENRGTAALARLAGLREFGEHRVEAAAAVAARDPGRGLPLLNAITGDSRVPGPARLVAAQTLLRHDSNTGMQALAALAQAPEADPPTRIDAASHLIAVDPTTADLLLSQLANDHDLPDDLRVQAARLRIEHLGHPPALLAEFSENADNDISLRLKAGHELGNLDPRQGATALIALASSVSDGATTLEALEQAATFDPVRAVARLTELASPAEPTPIDHLAAAAAVEDIAGPPHALPLYLALAEDDRTGGNLRLKAAEAALDIDRRSGLAVIARLARNKSIAGPTRVAAADQVAKHDIRQAVTLHAELCADTSLSVDLRLRAGEAAGPAGVAPLIQMSRQSKVDGQARLSAAMAALKRDQARGVAALAAIASSPQVASATRLRAVELVPDKKQTLRLYLELAENRSADDHTRLSAATAAAEINRRLGAAALRKLADSAQLGRSARQTALERADRYQR